MIVLDTNVVSEVMKPEPNPAVRKWLNEQPVETLYLSSVSVAEMLFGIGMLPEGRRKRLLSEMLNSIIELFEDRVLAFDIEAAKSYSRLAVKARVNGRGFPLPDGYIAAIAAARGFAVATRDTGPFDAAGITAVNPWENQ
ncbi:MAG: type II toxin-antitoxin system VapC family toxin [Synergistaceae bacterium]|jgi:predicted nucleic acid-binding protein|nr:type II toxin-antitoxin system VapC family toxin [Synergistaceae bacterium]